MEKVKGGKFWASVLIGCCVAPCCCCCCVPLCIEACYDHQHYCANCGYMISSEEQQVVHQVNQATNTAVATTNTAIQNGLR